MSALDGARLAALARALGLPPRQLLVAAARLARDTAPARGERRRAIVHDARARLAACDGSAALLLATPIAGFAQDDADRALAAVWPASRRTDA